MPPSHACRSHMAATQHSDHRLIAAMAILVQVPRIPGLSCMPHLSMSSTKGAWVTPGTYHSIIFKNECRIPTFTRLPALTVHFADCEVHRGSFSMASHCFMAACSVHQRSLSITPQPTCRTSTYNNLTTLILRRFKQLHPTFYTGSGARARLEAQHRPERVHRAHQPTRKDAIN